jgi:hypothetical protein
VREGRIKILWEEERGERVLKKKEGDHTEKRGKDYFRDRKRVKTKRREERSEER